MKKISVALIVLTLLLSGCNVPFMGKSPEDVSQDTQLSQEQTAVQQQATASQDKDRAIPSTDDGAIYIQALSTHDVKVCAKIVNKELNAKCIETVVAGK